MTHRTDRAEIANAIRDQWLARVKASGLKPKTMAYKRAEVEFAAGAMAALVAVFKEDGKDEMPPQVPAIWVINAMSGRPIFE